LNKAKNADIAALHRVFLTKFNLKYRKIYPTELT